MYTLDLKIDKDLADCVVSKKEDPIGYAALNKEGGIQYKFNFNNGYGASVIKHPGSYGNEDDLWELALLKDDCSGGFGLCYTGLVNDDVLGHLSDAMVNKVLRAISLGKVEESIPDLYS